MTELDSIDLCRAKLMSQRENQWKGGVYWIFDWFD